MTLTTLGMPSAAIRVPAPGMPTSGPLLDTFGRAATDLRVSLTDRCNLRCTYCMPAEGLDWMANEQMLRTDELVRLLRIAVTRLGITNIRFTGGEPLVAKNLREVITAAAGLTPRPSLSLTTNGVSLARQARALADAGLDRVNVSLDTVDRAHFAAITRRDRLDDVLEGLAAAAAAGLSPVKVNAVLEHENGLDDAVTLLEFCLEHGYQLRIIEQMPLDAEHLWDRGDLLTADVILAHLNRHFTLRPHPVPRGSAPAQLWQVDGRDGSRSGTVGVIASVSKAFCSACDRTRLTADGQVRNCLFATTETDLRSLLRSGAPDRAIEMAWRSAMWAKAAGHGINEPGFVQPTRPMSAIGG